MARTKLKEIRFYVTDLELMEMLSMAAMTVRGDFGKSKLPIVTLMNKMKEAGLQEASEDQKLVLYKLLNAFSEVSKDLDGSQMPYMNYLERIMDGVNERVDADFTAKQKKLVQIPKGKHE